MASRGDLILERARGKPPELAKEYLLEGIRDYYRRSLYHTAKDLLEYGDMTRHTHQDMIQALESPTRRKLIVMPRGTFKSSIGVVAFSIWCLMRNPNERILIDSELYGNSKNFMREIKAHLQSPRLRLLFGPWEGPVWTEGEIIIAQRTKAYKESSVTCGGVETVKVGQHYSIIIADDLNSGNNSATTEGRRKIIQHHQMNTAILEPDGTIVVIGTRYATDDIIGWVMENELGGLTADAISASQSGLAQAENAARVE